MNRPGAFAEYISLLMSNVWEQRNVAITDISDHRLKLASAFQDILDNLCHGGKVAVLGIPDKDYSIDWEKVIFSMITIRGVYGREMYETWYKMSVFIESGLDLNPVIIHRLPFDGFQQGFDVMESGKAGKVVLDWTKC